MFVVAVLFGGSRLCVVTVLFVVNRLCVVSFLFVVRRPCMVGSLFVVSRLALRWGEKRPQSSRRVYPGRTQWPVLGPLRSPAQGKPAHHKGCVRHSGIGSPQRVCSSQQTTPLVRVEESRRFCGGCAFCGEPAVCGGFAFCSEQACPALGREAAPIQSPRFSRQNPMAGFRAASQPSAGQACSPQKGCVRHQV